jgi:hypothetical protein
LQKILLKNFYLIKTFGWNFSGEEFLDAAGFLLAWNARLKDCSAKDGLDASDDAEGGVEVGADRARVRERSVILPQPSRMMTSEALCVNWKVDR